jgi:(p)ppGpp synthase/HD superfamily hydrolase
MMKFMDYNLLDSALIFAAKAHANQYRKGTDIPYITHPVGVAMILLELGCSWDVVIAGLLHDVVEDTPVSLVEIEEHFGETIAALVQSVSEPNRTASWEERKKHTLSELKGASLPTKLITCADKLHNLRSLSRDYAGVGEAVWSRFKRGRADQAWYYSGLKENLAEGVEDLAKYPIFAEFNRAVEALFGEDVI